MSLRFKGLSELSMYLEMKSPQLEYTPKQEKKRELKGPSFDGPSF